MTEKFCTKYHEIKWKKIIFFFNKIIANLLVK